MGEHTETLRRLSQEILAPGTLAQLRVVMGKGRPLLDDVVRLDKRLGGPSLAAVDGVASGRYAAADRDVFRPLQYCRTHFERMLASDEGDWLARDVVEMSSLHIEALVKRIGRVGALPLGQALRSTIARRRIEPAVWHQIGTFTHVYNRAKHYFGHAKDTHLFSVEDAVLSYFICRALGAELYPLASLVTDIRVFS